MRIVNRTAYPTSLLRTWLARWRAESAKHEPVRSNLIVEIKYGRRRNWVGGRARLNGRHVWLHLTRGRLDIVDLCATWLHELDHIRGYRHGQMPKMRAYYEQGTALVGPGLDPRPHLIEPERQKPAAKPKPPLVERRLVRARGLLVRADRDAVRYLALAKAARRRSSLWAAKIRRLEMRAAAASPAPPKKEVIPNDPGSGPA